jgi:hypothetical protein
VTTKVVAFATTPPRRSAVERPVAEIVARGGEIVLGCWFDPVGLMVQAEIGEARMIAGSAITERLVGRRRWWRRRRAPSIDLAAEQDLTTRRWLQARSDPWLADAVARADYLVALDQDAVYPVWEFARAHPGVRAAFGLPAITATLAGRLTLSDGRELRRTLPSA